MLKSMKKAVGSSAPRLINWLMPAAPDRTAAPIDLAQHLTDRRPFSDLLTHREFDPERNLIYLDDGDEPALAFVIQFAPLLLAGLDAESQIEAAINACPPDSILQFGVLSSPYVTPTLEAWLQGRLKGGGKVAQNLGEEGYAVLSQAARRRVQFMQATMLGTSMLPATQMHPRNIQYFVTVRIPYKGDVSDQLELEAWVETGVDTRDAIQGALQGAGLYNEVLDDRRVRLLLRELLNPHIAPDERVDNLNDECALHEALMERETRVRVCDDGTIGFSRTPGATDEALERDVRNGEVRVVPMTIDGYPRRNYLPKTAALLGDPLARDERIPCPYWAYTTIHVLDPDRASEQLTAKLGALNKQAMSESQWYRAMMSHLFQRRDEVADLAQVVRDGSHQPVRVYSGINLFSTPANVKRDSEHVRAIWRRAGFRVSPERFISLPVMLASLPAQYTPKMDPPERGLQRARTAHSLNAASFALCQGDWLGTAPHAGGPLLVSRRGQLATIDLWTSETNYNFTVVAASGSGKSFFAAELVGDVLARGGIVRIVDAGGSYARLAEIMGGQNMVFDPDDPKSLNPLWGIVDRRDFDELLPMLKDLIRQMAYPKTPDDQLPAWEYQFIEHAVEAAWQKHAGETDLSHVYDFLVGHQDQRAKDLASQLYTYAKGRLSPWFCGPREISFDNPFVIVELNRLNSDPELRATVLTLAMYQITQEMYLSDRGIPKLLGVDEAWDLLSNVKTGAFIERLFRVVRKFNGAAGVITQAFGDFDLSPAARAALDNSAWQFVLHQKGESLSNAVETKKVVAEKHVIDLLKTVKSGAGFSEIYVRHEAGQGIYRFIVDRHSYYTYTTHPRDIAAIERLQKEGRTLSQAIDYLATEDYKKLFAAQEAG